MMAFQRETICDGGIGVYSQDSSFYISHEWGWMEQDPTFVHKDKWGGYRKKEQESWLSERINEINFTDCTNMEIFIFGGLLPTPSKWGTQGTWIMWVCPNKLLTWETWRQNTMWWCYLSLIISGDQYHMGSAPTSCRGSNSADHSSWGLDLGYHNDHNKDQAQWGSLDGCLTN